MLEQVKEDFKDLIIKENNEEFYYKTIGDRIKKLNVIKESTNFLFNNADEEFKKNIIAATLEENKNKSESEQIFELVWTEIALDTLLN